MRLKVRNDNVKLTTKTNILEVEIPPEMENNIPTGMEHFNLLMAGDGVTPSSAIMMTGVPGAGKTTMCLQLADALTRMGHVAVFNGNEESIFQMRRKVRSLGLRHGFIVSQETDVWKLVVKLDQVRSENAGKHVFLIQDSLPTLEVPNYIIDEKTNRPETVKGRGKDAGSWKVGKGRPASGDGAVVRATEVLTDWAKETYQVVVMLGHVTKNGDFAGKQKIKHIIDAHVHLDFDKDRRSDTYGERVVNVEKNRFGIAGLYYPFEISDRGVRFFQDRESK